MSAPQAGRRLDEAGDRVRDAASDGWQGLQPLLDYEVLRFAGLELTVGRLLAAILVLVLVVVGSRLLARALCRYGERRGASTASVYAATQIVHYLLLAIGVVIALEVAGVPVSRFAVFAGALGVGLGFGLQAIFNNFVSGLILLFDKSIKIGDFVELESGVHGEVRDISIRATRISTNDNLNILVPNSEFVSGRVVNWTLLEAARRMHIPFGVAYGTDKERVKLAALEAAHEVRFTLDLSGPRRPQVWLTGFGESSLDFELVVWINAEATKRPSAVRAAYNWALHSALCKYGIELPFPQRDLHVRSVFGDTGGRQLAGLAGRPEGTPAAPPPAPRPAEVDAPAKARLSENDALREVEEGIAADEGANPAQGEGDNETNRREDA